MKIQIQLKFNPQVSDMQIITQFQKFFGEKNANFSKSLDIW